MIKRPLALASLLVMLAAGAAPLSADSLAERRAVVQELFDEVLTEQMNNELLDAMLPLFRAQLKEQLAAMGIALDAERMAKIETIVIEETNSMIDRIMPPSIGIYAEVFTLEELEALLAFYRTPAGASTMRKMPAVVQAMNPLLLREMTALTPILEQRLDAEVFGPDAQ